MRKIECHFPIIRFMLSTAAIQRLCWGPAEANDNGKSAAAPAEMEQKSGEQQPSAAAEPETGRILSHPERLARRRFCVRSSSKAADQWTRGSADLPRVRLLRRIPVRQGPFALGFETWRLCVPSKAGVPSL